MSDRGPRARSLADAALEATGAAVFMWCAQTDRLAFAGGASGLGLAELEGASWAQFVAAFVAADQDRVAGLTQTFRRDVVIARLAGRSGRFRRVRVRVAPGGEGAFLGLITPAFGADGEVDDLGRLGHEPALRDAARRGDFEAWYQPIVGLRERTRFGFEALIRWPDPDRGLLGPDDFLPLAEALGLMPTIGAWMRETAARRLAAWRAASAVSGAGLGPGPAFVAVNITDVELMDPGLVDQVADLRRRYDLPERALKLEIPETLIMRDPDAVAEALRALRKVGAGLALDDFGAGATALSWLDRLPLDSVKIDRYFVRGFDASESARTILASVIRLAKDLGLEVVAEGVESEATAKALAALGCDEGQGFWFAGALTDPEADSFVEAARPG